MIPVEQNVIVNTSVNGHGMLSAFRLLLDVIDIVTLL